MYKNKVLVLVAYLISIMMHIQVEGRLTLLHKAATL